MSAAGVSKDETFFSSPFQISIVYLFVLESNSLFYHTEIFGKYKFILLFVKC
jgi:hypothetical protein